MLRDLKIMIVISKPAFHGYMVPLGYLYVSSALKSAGCDVRVINAFTASGNQQEIVRSGIKDYRPNLLITGTSYKFHNNCPSPTIHSALEITNITKSLDETCTTLLIGPLNAVLASLLLRDPTVDALALGEPEDICITVAQALAEGLPLSQVKGLAIRNGEEIQTTGSTSFPDPNELPFPDRHAVDFSRYIFNSYYAPRTTELLTSRGCPFDCTYCFGAKSSERNAFNIGKPFRASRSEKVVEEIDLLYHRWGVRGIKFSDVEFCVSNTRVAEICDLLLKKGYKGLRWRIVTHAKSVSSDLLDLMYRAGCRNIYYGVESGDKDILKAMDKRVSLDEIRETFRSTWKAGIRPEASFLLGFPGENEESIQRTIRFSKEINPFVATFHVFVPYPGIRVGGQLKTDPSLELDHWDVYQLHTNRSYCDVPSGRLESLSKMAYREFYIRPAYLGRMLIQSTNPTMLRFLWNLVKGRYEGSFLKNMLLGNKKNTV